MILKIWKTWLCCGFMPIYFGGDSKSDSSTSTTNNTTNNALSVDRRSVASDAAVSLTGDNNIVDRSTSSTTNFSDSSNRSTNFSDSSNRSVTVTDFGSVGSSLSTLGQMTTKALDITGASVNGAIDALKYISDNNQKSVSGAFDLAKSASANALTNSAAVLGFASSAIDKTNAAFAEAKDNGTSKLVTYALVAVGVIGVAFALK